MQPQLPALFSESNKCLSGRDAQVMDITCGQHTQEGFALQRPKMWRRSMLMKLETQTFDLYAKVIAIAFATVIRLCAPFRCQPCFQMSNSLIGLLLEGYIPSCSVKPQLVRDLKAKAAAIATVLLLCSAVSTPSFFSNMEIVHWLET